MTKCSINVSGLIVFPERSVQNIYTNVLFADLRDDSGLRIFYTPNLRPQEAGTLALGHSVSLDHIIPPYADSFRTVGYCPGECTEKVIDSYIITYFNTNNELIY